jgi:hypothetical protein
MEEFSVEPDDEGLRLLVLGAGDDQLVAAVAVMSMLFRRT